jgi:hypothetical protein
MNRGLIVFMLALAVVFALSIASLVLTSQNHANITFDTSGNGGMGITLLAKPNETSGWGDAASS